MGSKAFFLVYVLVACYGSADSRNLSPLSTENHMNLHIEISERMNSNTVMRNENLCNMCEEFTAEATTYLGENKTQTEIVDALHRACSRAHGFKEQCVLLVDYYAPLFFVEISNIQVEQICIKMNLCQGVKFNLPKSDDVCTVCHQVVDQVIIKLQDPDTQLEIIEILLKECKRAEHYANKCKKLVFQYGPLILSRSEKFLEANDICAILHGCEPSPSQQLSEELLADA